MVGTGIVLLPCGTVEGRQAKAFECTDCYVLTQKDFKLRIETEIARVRSLQGDGALWVTDHCTQEDGIFEEDPLTKLSGIGNKTAEILTKYEVKLVVDAALLGADDIQILCDEPGLGEERFWQMRS